jgi:hypothetical protein
VHQQDIGIARGLGAEKVFGSGDSSPQQLKVDEFVLLCLEDVFPNRQMVRFAVDELERQHGHAGLDYWSVSLHRLLKLAFRSARLAGDGCFSNYDRRFAISPLARQV